MGSLLLVSFAVALAGADAGADAAAPGPSVAVMTLAAKEGVHADVAEQLTEAMVTRVRKTGRFSRVVSSGEIQALMTFAQQKQLLQSFEQQRQLSQCTSTFCLAEIANALGVDYIISGTIGRIGRIWLVNVRLLNVATASAESSVSRPIQAPDEGALIQAMESVTDELVAGSHLPAPEKGRFADSSPVPGPVAAGTAAKRSSPLVLALRVVGGSGLGAAALLAVTAVLAGAAAGGTYGLGVYASMNRVPRIGLMRTPMDATVVGGIVVAGAGLALALLAGVVGGSGLVASFVVGATSR